MKLILVNNEFYLLSEEDFNEGDYYCVFATGIKGVGRGWSEPRLHVNSNIDKLSKCTINNYKGKVIASSVKIGNLPLIDHKQIIHGENFVPYVKNLSDDINIETVALDYAKSQIVEGKNEWLADVELNEFGTLIIKEGYVNIIKIK